MNLKPRAVLGVVMRAAIFAFVAAPLQAQTPEYGGIGATTPSFYAANPHGPGKPPAGITYYRVDGTRNGRVLNYYVVVGWKAKRSGSGLLARLSGRRLPIDAKAVNGYCAVYRSQWLGRVIGPGRVTAAQIA